MKHIASVVEIINNSGCSGDSLHEADRYPLRLYGVNNWKSELTGIKYAGLQSSQDDKLNELGHVTSRGGDMKIIPAGIDKKTGKPKYKLDMPVRKNGKPTHIKKTAIGSNDLKNKIAQIQSLAESSLTNAKAVTLKECIDAVLKQNDGAGIYNTYQKIRRELGDYAINNSFKVHYYDFIQHSKDEGLSVNTISNYASIIRRSLNFAFKIGLIDDIPIRSWDITREYRDRVWKPDERNHFFKAMVDLDSHLYWAVYFAERNPIRINDLFNLTEENLVLVGTGVPYVRLRPSKTSKKKPRDTYLTEIDDKLLQYLVHDRPKGTPFLFPYIEKLSGKVSNMGNPRRHWQTLCRTAGVNDFKFHDLKHCAITYMLNFKLANGTNKYSIQDLKELGIQYSDVAIQIYLNMDAENVLSRLSGKSTEHALVSSMKNDIDFTNVV